jgi:hypothetical protein
MAGFKVDTSGVQSTSSTKSTTSNVDYKSMNEEIISIVGISKKAKPVVGFPSGYIDLGLQPRPDFEQLRDANDAKQNKALAEGTASVVVKDLFDNGTKHTQVEVFCNPRKPAKAFTLVIDFPQYQVDKGKYFGDETSGPSAYRMYMGGEWSVQDPEDEAKRMRIIQNHMYLVENTNNPVKKWALGIGTTIAKMCVAADLEDEDGLVSKDSITGVLGKPMMFSIRTYMKPDRKDDSKSYFTEDIKFAGALAEGMNLPDFDESTIHGVNFNQANDLDMLNLVRFTAKNTMKRAEGWKDSVIYKEIEQAKKDWKANKDAEDKLAEESKPANKESKKVATSNEPEPDDYTSEEDSEEIDDDIPF